MLELNHDWLIAAFSVSNSVRALFYLPQVIAVARSVDGARDIALSTWWMWAANNALGAVYAGVVMYHRVLAISFLLSAVACLVIIALALRARRRMNRCRNGLGVA
jgi:hypothetical protein